MKEVFDALNRMIGKNAQIQQSSLPAEIKDEAMSIVNNALEMCVKLPQDINTEVMEIYRKNMVKKLK